MVSAAERAGTTKHFAATSTDRCVVTDEKCVTDLHDFYRIALGEQQSDPAELTARVERLAKGRS